MCAPGAKPNVERPINPAPALDSPIHQQPSICTRDYLFPPRAHTRVVNRPANSGRAIDVTGSWLSDGFGDPLSRYRCPGGRPAVPLFAPSWPIAETYFYIGGPAYVLTVSLFRRGNERQLEKLRERGGEEERAKRDNLSWTLEDKIYGPGVKKATRRRVVFIIFLRSIAIINRPQSSSIEILRSANSNAPGLFLIINVLRNVIKIEIAFSRFSVSSSSVFADIVVEQIRRPFFLSLSLVVVFR